MFQILRRILCRNLNECGKNNVINNESFPECQFSIMGDNNKVVIYPTARLKGKIAVYGNDNLIQIGASSVIKAEIIIGRPDSSFACKARKCQLKIGNKVYFGNTSRIVIEDDGTKVSIGNASIFAEGTQILASDMHSIIDEDGNLLNRAEFVSIGDHVWCCTGVKILKNSVVSNNSVIAAGSIVNHAFNEENALIAGNPAKIVRHQIHWDKLSPNLYRRRQGIEREC